MENSEKPSFSLVFSNYKQKIFEIAYRIFNNVTEAEDITQEVFLRAYRGYENFRFESEVYSWLYRIAVNLCREKIRGKTKTELLRKGNDASQNVEGYVEFYFPDASGTTQLCFDSRFDFSRPIATVQYLYNAAIMPAIENTPTSREIILKIAQGKPVDLHRTTELTFADSTTLSYELAKINDNGTILTTEDLKQAKQEIQAGKDWEEVTSAWNTETIIQNKE